MSIFVQIAAYRDSELIPTIEDLLAKAFNPEQLSICICRQFHPNDNFDNIDKYRSDSRFKIIDIYYQDSKGVCWARNLIQQFYSGETYTLQVDSHSRFIWGWDKKMLQMMFSLEAKGIKKPLLTGYPAAYEPGRENEINTISPPLQMVISHFSSDGIPIFDSEPLPESDSLIEPVPARFYSAGFCFTLGSFCRDVKYDSDLYFLGEEISIAVRAFTHGYDLFHPHLMLVWHYYNRPYSIKHWDDDKDWSYKNQKSLLKIRSLLGISKDSFSSTEFGLGKIRSLADYEVYSGIDFLSSSIRKELLDKKFPILKNVYVKDEFWFNGLARGYEIDFDIDFEMFSSISYLLVYVFDIDNELVYQEKLEKRNIIFSFMPSFLNLKIYFFSFYIPVRWRVNILNQMGILLEEIKQRMYSEEEQKKVITCNL